MFPCLFLCSSAVRAYFLLLLIAPMHASMPLSCSCAVHTVESLVCCVVFRCHELESVVACPDSILVIWIVMVETAQTAEKIYSHASPKCSCLLFTVFTLCRHFRPGSHVRSRAVDCDGQTMLSSLPSVSISRIFIGHQPKDLSCLLPRSAVCPEPRSSP